MKIVIVGGGFGGVYTANYLNKILGKRKDVEIALVNDTNYFLFTPLLHEVATGSLSALSVAEPIREIFRKTKVKFYQAKVTDIDYVNKKIKTELCELGYDYLVLATGAKTNYYHIDAKETFDLKNLADALRIRTQIIDALEEAAVEDEAEKVAKLLNFIVVGGGPTGVELAAEMADFIHETIAKEYKPHDLPVEQIKITLIHGAKELVTNFHPKIRKIAKKVLEKKKINVLLNERVEEVKDGIVRLGSGVKIPSRTIIWTAGVKPNFPTEEPIEVNNYLQTVQDKNTFALGDVAMLATGRLPMLAQVAVAQARVVAANLAAIYYGKPLTKYRLKLKGSLISLGSWRAAGQIGPFVIHGRFTWWLWRTIYLFKFLSWRKRFKIATEWTINLFLPRDITKV